MRNMITYTGEFIPELQPEHFSRGLLIDLVKLYSKLYLAIDGFWYLSAMNKIDELTATECDIWVWEKQSRYEISRITKLLDIRERDIKAFFKYLQFNPWVWNLDYKMELKNHNFGIWTITKCPTFDALEKEGKGREKNFCKSIETRIFGVLAKNFNQAITFKYLKLPPRNTIDGPYCKWQFEIE